MTEERLKEIKDSIYCLDYEFAVRSIGKTFISKHLQQERELYKEVIRLREIIDKTNKYLDKLIEYGIRNEDDDLKEMSLLLNDENYIDITTKRLKQYNLTLEQLGGIENE